MSSLPDPVSHRPRFLLEGGLVCGVTLLTVVTTALEGRPVERDLDVLGYALLTGAGLSLAGIRRTPRLTLALTFAFFFLYTTLGYPDGTGWLPHAIALAGAVAAGHRLLGLGVAGLIVVWIFGVRLLEETDTLIEGEVVVALMGLGVALLTGEWLRMRRDYISAAEHRAMIAELTKEEEARRRVADERIHIAREMHDVLAHALASINVQAGATLHVLDKHPQEAAGALRSIKAASTEALEELRATVATMRGNGDAPSRLGNLDRLAESARKSGLRVTIGKQGSPGRLPPAVDLAAFRILQESVTNAIRHAAPANLTIEIDYRPHELVVSVEDDGVGATGEGRPQGGGNGIAGMRERAAELGGTLAAGPGPDRGFLVRAAFPLAGPQR